MLSHCRRLLLARPCVQHSPSRMVKFDMPSFDSQNSDEVQNNLSKSVEDRSVQCEAGEDLADTEFWLKLNKLLEYLQRLETNNRIGDHEVLGTFSLERLAWEADKWRKILRQSVSNVLRIQNTISDTSRSEGPCGTPEHGQILNNLQILEQIPIKLLP